MGTSRRPRQSMQQPWDHPHAYGDKLDNFSVPCSTEGSSPRVWGQALDTENYHVTRRIIPTRMGTSSAVKLMLIALWDHPHAYGDKSPAIDAAAVFVGSSPRVWGQVFDRELEAIIDRIIPTRMGTSLDDEEIQLILEDHPHAYGDKLNLHYTSSKIIGSSPRVWGQD